MHPRIKAFSRLAQLGLFAVTAIALILGLFYFHSLTLGRGGYHMGVHFATAGGLAEGARVYLNGVDVGSISDVRLLRDNSVDVILEFLQKTDIPRGSTFAVQSALTGSSHIAITSPIIRGNPPIWEKHILPVSEQPVGAPPANLDVLMHSGQSLTAHTQVIFGLLQAHKHQMLAHLQNSRSNAQATPVELHEALTRLMGQRDATLGLLTSKEKDEAEALRKRDQPKISTLASSMSGTVQTLDASVGALRAMGRDPRIRENVRQVSEQMQVSMSNMAAVTDQLRGITQDPQTRAELLDTTTRLRALLQRVNIP